MHNCEICRYLRLEPRTANGAIGLHTAIQPLVEAAVDRLDSGAGSEAHVMLAVCPDHVVDIYRGRVDGVTMAWRLAVPR
jgi:hypothetical protein